MTADDALAKIFYHVMELELLVAHIIVRWLVHCFDGKYFKKCLKIVNFKVEVINKGKVFFMYGI